MEIERARLTKRLAKLKEEEGNIDEAAEILQEVAVVRSCMPLNCLNPFLNHVLCAIARSKYSLGELHDGVYAINPLPMRYAKLIRMQHPVCKL